jgi:diaminopimelate epimerase
VKIAFSKYHGSGNDFILIDNREGVYPIDAPDLMRRLCNRHEGIGADGVLIVGTSKIADYQMRIFNADGSNPAMCGNGIRCAFDFLANNTSHEQLYIEVGQRILFCRRIGGKIGVDLGVPHIAHWPITLALDAETMPIYVLDTGVLHAVLFVEDIWNIPLLNWGKQIRSHAAFAPGGVNVNFAKITADGSIMVRTFERGVEGETLACGTGAAATAWVAAHVHGLIYPISIKTRSGFHIQGFEESLVFSFPVHAQGEKHIEMIGPAHCVFTGQFDYAQEV